RRRDEPGHYGGWRYASPRPSRARSKCCPELPDCAVRVVHYLTVVVEDHGGALGRCVPIPGGELRCVRVAAAGEGDPRVAHAAGERPSLPNPAGHTGRF